MMDEQQEREFIALVQRTLADQPELAAKIAPFVGGLLSGEFVTRKGEKRPTGYVVWELRQAPASREGVVTSLRAICTEQALAGAYRKMLADEEQCLRAWVEPRWINHLYGGEDVEQTRDAVRQRAALGADPVAGTGRED